MNEKVSQNTTNLAIAANEVPMLAHGNGPNQKNNDHYLGAHNSLSTYQ